MYVCLAKMLSMPISFLNVSTRKFTMACRFLVAHITSVCNSTDMGWLSWLADSSWPWSWASPGLPWQAQGLGVRETWRHNLACVYDLPLTREDQLQLLPTAQISRQRLILSPGDAVIFLKSKELQSGQWLILALYILEGSELFGVYF